MSELTKNMYLAFELMKKKIDVAEASGHPYPATKIIEVDFHGKSNVLAGVRVENGSN